jgi:hypothetical protein
VGLLGLLSILITYPLQNISKIDLGGLGGKPQKNKYFLDFKRIE